MTSLYENDAFFLKLCPSLRYFVCPKSKVHRIKFSEWDLKRYFERISHPIKPLQTQVILREDKAEIILLLDDFIHTCSYRQKLNQLTHIVNNSPVIVTEYLIESDSELENPRFQLTRSIWIYNVPAKLFHLHDDTHSQFMDIKSNTLRICLNHISSEIENVEVVSTDEKQSGIEDLLNLRKNICVRFNGYPECLRVLQNLRGFESPGPVTLVAQARLPSHSIPFHCLQVSPDLSGYLMPDQIQKRNEDKEFERREILESVEQFEKISSVLSSLRERRDSLTLEADQLQQKGCVEIDHCHLVHVMDVFSSCLSRVSEELSHARHPMGRNTRQHIERLMEQANSSSTSVNNAISQARQALDKHKMKEEQSLAIAETQQISEGGEVLWASLSKSTQIHLTDPIFAVIACDESRENFIRKLEGNMKGVTRLLTTLRKMLDWPFDRRVAKRAALTSCCEMIGRQWDRISPHVDSAQSLLISLDDVLIARSLVSRLVAKRLTQDSTASGNMILSVAQKIQKAQDTLLHYLTSWPSAELLTSPLCSRMTLLGSFSLSSQTQYLIELIEAHVTPTETLIRLAGQKISLASGRTVPGPMTHTVSSLTMIHAVGLVKDAMDRASYRLARVQTLGATAIEKMCSVDADDALLAFSNACGVCSVEISEAMQECSQAEMTEEDSLSMLLRGEERRRVAEGMLMRLEDERGFSLRTLQYLYGRKEELEKRISSQLSCDRWSSPIADCGPLLSEPRWRTQTPQKRSRSPGDSLEEETLGVGTPQLSSEIGLVRKKRFNLTLSLLASTHKNRHSQRESLDFDL
jgi:hypothetical protein